MQATLADGGRAQAVSLALRRGPSYWFQSYLHMVTWELLSLRLFLPVMAAVQFLIGAGIVLGLGFLFDDISTTQATYLATGGAVLPLITLGLVMIPQMVAQQKLEGTADFLFALPVPRMAMYFAGLTVFSVTALPPAASALVVAAWRYDLALHVSLLAVPAAVLVVGGASAIGFAMGHGIPNPRITNLVTQIMIFVVVMFSPINFPAERLPEWLQALHTVLPLQHSAILMRSTLTDGMITGATWPSWLVVGAWTAGAWLFTYAVITRRG